jgi:hypothetical protein
MTKHVITVNDVLDGHVVLDAERLDRIYVNAYVRALQASSPIGAFLSGHALPGAVPALLASGSGGWSTKSGSPRRESAGVTAP